MKSLHKQLGMARKKDNYSVLYAELLSLIRKKKKLAFDSLPTRNGLEACEYREARYLIIEKMFEIQTKLENYVLTGRN